MSQNTATTAGQRKGVVLESHQVIVRPLVTEKGIHAATTANQYAFEISTFAGKEDVRRAIEELFNVKVLKVRTQMRKGKARRHKFRLGHTKSWKKAVVTVHAEQRIDFF